MSHDGQTRISHRRNRSRSLVPGIDGRSARARFVRDTFARLCSDQGGIERMGEARQGLTLAFAVSLSIVREAAESYVAQQSFDLEALNQNISNMVRISQRIGIDPKVVDVTPGLDGIAERYR